MKIETEGIEKSIISMLNDKTPIIRNVADKKKKIATLEAESTALSRVLIIPLHSYYFWVDSF